MSLLMIVSVERNPVRDRSKIEIKVADKIKLVVSGETKEGSLVITASIAICVESQMMANFFSLTNSPKLVISDKQALMSQVFDTDSQLTAHCLDSTGYSSPTRKHNPDAQKNIEINIITHSPNSGPDHQ